MDQSIKYGHQKIACDVRSCIHNQCMECAEGVAEGVCALSEIHVAPKCGCSSKGPDESLCSTYKARGCC